MILKRRESVIKLLSKIIELLDWGGFYYIVDCFVFWGEVRIEIILERIFLLSFLLISLFEVSYNWIYYFDCLVDYCILLIYLNIEKRLGKKYFFNRVKMYIIGKILWF